MLEGALILVAALIIAVEAIPRLLHPQPIEQAFVGRAFSVFGALINGMLAWFMAREGKKQRSIMLEADAHHPYADVLTTVGVVVGVLLVALTHWYLLDPLVALLVAVNIIWTGVKLLRQTGLGLLDTVLPKVDLGYDSDFCMSGAPKWNSYLQSPALLIAMLPKMLSWRTRETP